MTGRAPTLARERALLDEGARTVAGIDEVGRGALAGPVAVGVTVVALDTADPPDGLADSKMISASRRERLEPVLAEWCLAHAIGWAGPREIDDGGIIAALGVAASRALAALPCLPDAVILDGNHDWLSPALGATAPTVEMLVGADGSCASVSAASVLAKVARDRHMAELSADFPDYHWSANKGYGSAAHREAILRHGPTAHHRLSWRLS